MLKVLAAVSRQSVGLSRIFHARACCTLSARANICWIFQVSFVFAGGRGQFAKASVHWSSTEGAWIFVLWSSKHAEFPMFFLADVKQTCWISRSLMFLCVANDWVSKVLQAFVCIGHLQVLNILGVCAATL